MKGWSLTDVRKGLWHLRNGGPSELKEFVRRNRSSNVLSKNVSFTKRSGNAASDWPEWPIPESFESRHDLRVGVVADDFTRLAMRYEWQQVDLRPSTWEAELECGLDLLFVESAWHGVDEAWRYMLTGTKAPSECLRNLVAACQATGIPTVFWNKEDPVHFEDFLDTAKLFDWVFTTEEAKVADYRRELGHDRVAVLPFAAQQSIHNPIRPPGFRTDELSGVAFAGTYFQHKYPERRDQLDLLLGGTQRAVAKDGANIDIYSRFAGTDPNYEFPAEYQQYVQGELNYRQMLMVNRGYRVLVNVNSVPTSQSMCGRRVFEISACGTPVLTCPTPAISSAFPGGSIPEAANEDEAYEWVRSLLRSEQLRDRLTHLSQRQIWQEHTYTHRVNKLLSLMGMEDKVHRQPTVSAMISTNRPAQLEHVLGQMVAQKNVDLEVLVLCHGFMLPENRKAALESEFGPVVWIEADSTALLGECYNILAQVASGDVVAKIDDDDWYGPHYLFEQVAAIDYAAADVVGKGAHHVYLENADATVLRFPESEHKYRPFVSGPTIVSKRDVVLDAKFPNVQRGEDTGFLHHVSGSGGTIFSSSRFGFLQERSSRGDHTWNIADLSIFSTGEVVAYGKAFDHVIF